MPYDGTDQVVRELRMAREDARAACLAELDALARLAELAGDGKSAPVVEAIASLRPDGGLPVHVENPSAAADLDPAISAIEESGAALHAALWFIAGLLGAGLPGYGLYRVVMPRA
jgi:hypothetical protein